MPPRLTPHSLSIRSQVQSLDISRHPSYTLGRAGKIVVPDESVSRIHAALVHGPTGPDGRSTVHVVDIKSAKGTFVDRSDGHGWKRLPPNAPMLLPPGGKLRLGDCSTLIVLPTPAPPPTPAPAPAPEPAAAPAASASLLSATIQKHQAAAESSAEVAVGEDGEEIDGEDLDGEQMDPPEEDIKLSNSDFRNALLPFLSAPKPTGDSDGKRGKSNKRKGSGDSEDSDVEPEPVFVLDKVGSAADAMGGGLILRKEKTKVKEKSNKKDKTMKIKF